MVPKFLQGCKAGDLAEAVMGGAVYTLILLAVVYVIIRLVQAIYAAL